MGLALAQGSQDVVARLAVPFARLDRAPGRLGCQELLERLEVAALPGGEPCPCELEVAHPSATTPANASPFGSSDQRR